MWIATRKLSLSHRIVASVALGLCLILLLFGLLALWTIRESTDAVYGERVALAEALAQHVDDVLGYAQVTLEREAAGLQIEPGRPLTQDELRQLAELRLRLGSFAIPSVTDAEGIVVWADPRQTDIVVGEPLDHPSVHGVLSTSEPQISEYRRPGSGDGSGEKTFACLAVPLRDSQGRLAGVLVAMIDPADAALNLLPSGELSDGMSAQLIDSAGSPLAGTSPESAAVEAEHRRILSDLIAARTAGYRIHQSSLPGMSSHLVAYAPVRQLPTWGVVVEQPRDMVLSVPLLLAQRLGLFGFAALLAAVAVAWLAARRVVGPLKRLTGAAERFAAGQLDEPVRLDRADELGILAQAFETMRQRLRGSLAEVAEWNRELEQRVAARTAEVEARNRELAHLNAIAETVSGTLDVEPMLERTLERVLQITEAETGCFLVAKGDDDTPTLAVERGFPADSETSHECVDCLCGRAARLDQVIGADEAVLYNACVPCSVSGLRSALAIPLPAGERVQGILFLGSHRPDHFQGMELATLAAIGQQVGMALANARLYQSLQAREHEREELLQKVMVAHEEERQRLAQELHDETSQALASLRLGLERLAIGREDREQARELAGQLQGVAAQTLGAVHRLAVELRPSVLDDVGLVAAVERYLRDCAQQWRLAIDFASVGVDHFRLIPAAETAVYRIVQAALTNVVQHARAQHVSVLLERRDGKLVVVVEDDGQGFDLDAVRRCTLESRLGLAGMEERASLIGATLTFETAPSTGTTIFLEVPLAPNSQKGWKERANGQVAADPR